MAALDLLGRRWTLRILWELRDGQAVSFRELRQRCDQMSTSVLNQRLHELREAGIIEISAGGYKLTKRGTELIDALTPLNAWANQWSRAQRPQGRGSRGSPAQPPNDPLPGGRNERRRRESRHR
jgi:DNA-binding HxlR family transcriptional regulator